MILNMSSVVKALNCVGAWCVGAWHPHNSLIRGASL